MAVWTDIADTLLEPGKPIRSVDGIALRENPKAIAEGAAGAPKIQTAALQTSAVTTEKMADSNVTAQKLATGTDESVWVANMFGNRAFGARGMPAFAVAVSGGSAAPGATRSGSDLRYMDFQGNTDGSTALSGTWRCHCANGFVGGVWMRVA